MWMQQKICSSKEQGQIILDYMLDDSFVLEKSKTTNTDVKFLHVSIDFGFFFGVSTIA